LTVYVVSLLCHFRGNTLIAHTYTCVSYVFEVMASEVQRWHFIHCFNVLQNTRRKKWLFDDGMTEIISNW